MTWGKTVVDGTVHEAGTLDAMGRTEKPVSSKERR